VRVEGRTAAWIVERPTKLQSQELEAFCDYGSVVFYNCNAEVTSAQGGDLVDRQLQRARLIRLADWTPQNSPTYQPGKDHPGIIVSSAAREGPDAALLYYIG
jgi:hypothetical protein